MGMLCAVSFTRYGRLYYLDAGEFRPEVGDSVLVGTDDGPVVAECIWGAEWVSEDTGGFPPLLGPAGKRDLADSQAIRTAKSRTKVAARRLIRAHDLPMKVLATDHRLSDDTSVVFFSAPSRVDFRSLVRDLASTLGRRVELKQLAERDAAKATGGIGSCGRELCCATFLTDFDPVSVKMARDQDLPTNPMRISGACGKLMCCLKYEHPLYQSFRQQAPAIGDQVETAQGTGTVTGHSVPRDAVTVELADGGGSCSCSLASVCGSRQAYDSRG